MYKKLNDKKSLSNINNLNIVTKNEIDEQENYDEIVAVITATIASIYESENNGSDDIVPFRVKSIVESK